MDTSDTRRHAALLARYEVDCGVGFFAVTPSLQLSGRAWRLLYSCQTPSHLPPRQSLFRLYVCQRCGISARRALVKQDEHRWVTRLEKEDLRLWATKSSTAAICSRVGASLCLKSSPCRTESMRNLLRSAAVRHARQEIAVGFRFPHAIE